MGLECFVRRILFPDVVRVNSLGLIIIITILSIESQSKRFRTDFPINPVAPVSNAQCAAIIVATVLRENDTSQTTLYNLLPPPDDVYDHDLSIT